MELRAITGTPISNDVMQKAIDTVAEKMYIHEGVYDVMADQNDDYSELYKSAFEGRVITNEALETLFYSDFQFDWYTQYEDSVLSDIGSTLSDIIFENPDTGNYVLNDIRQQVSAEFQNIADNLEFDYTDVVNHIQRNVEYWIGTDVISTIEELNSVASAGLSVAELQELAWFKPLSEIRSIIPELQGDLDAIEQLDIINEILDTTDLETDKNVDDLTAEEIDDTFVELANQAGDMVIYNALMNVMATYEITLSADQRYVIIY